MRIDCHMHTPLCGHAFGEPAAYVREAERQGIGLVTFTCHIPMEHEGFGGEGIRMRSRQLEKYRALVDEAVAVGKKSGVEVLRGIEAEVFPDPEIMTAMQATLDAQDFDFVLGSLHHQVPRYQDWIERNGLVDDHDIIEHYFQHLTEGAESGLYHSMSHPDVIRIYGTVEHFEPEEHESTIRDFLQAVSDADICIEVNTSGEAYVDHAIASARYSLCSVSEETEDEFVTGGIGRDGVRTVGIGEYTYAFTGNNNGNTWQSVTGRSVGHLTGHLALGPCCSTEQHSRKE